MISITNLFNSIIDNKLPFPVLEIDRIISAIFFACLTGIGLGAIVGSNLLLLGFNVSLINPLTLAAFAVGMIFSLILCGILNSLAQHSSRELAKKLSLRAHIKNGFLIIPDSLIKNQVQKLINQNQFELGSKDWRYQAIDSLVPGCLSKVYSVIYKKMDKEDLIELKFYDQVKYNEMDSVLRPVAEEMDFAKKIIVIRVSISSGGS